MVTTLGGLLRELRRQRGLSQERLAMRAQVTARTLRYWEADQQQPRDVELENAFRALGATAHERAQALSLLTDNRSVRLASGLETARSLSADDLGPLPGVGDLIRAMRLRRGWRQEQVAQTMHINRATIIRWEATQTLPSTEDIERLCVTLRAFPAERRVLKANRLLPDGWKAQLTLEECLEQLRLLSDLRFSRPILLPLMDLYALSLQRQLRFLLPKSPEALRLLAEVKVQQGWWLCMQDRTAEAFAANRQALDLVEGVFAPTWFWVDAINILALHIARGAGQQRQALRLMSSYVPLLPASLQLWPLCDMAYYASSNRDYATAQRFLSLAQQTLQQGSDMDAADVPYYRTTQARVLVNKGRPMEAMNWLPPVAASSERRVFSLRLWTETYLAAGDKEAAAACLEEAQSLLTALPLPAPQKTIDRLARLLY